MKCESSKHMIKDCKSQPVLTDTKDDEGNSKSKLKGKDLEKVASVNQPEPEKQDHHVASACVGKIFEGDSDKDVLDWDIADSD